MPIEMPTKTINRRTFLIASSLTALASTRVFGANDAIRIGVIGAGHRMQDLLDAAAKAGPTQIVAVSDVYTPNRDAVKVRSGGLASTHLDYREVLEQDIDVVFIASPDHWHVPMAVDALAAGKTSIWKSRSRIPSRKAPRLLAPCIPANEFCNAACSNAVGIIFAMPWI